MDYVGDIIRPPSEGDSILLQVTTGCSHNKCTFCGAYRKKRFSIKSDERIFANIAYAAEHFKRHRRLFLCDGDALILPQKRLVRILEKIRQKLPWVRRVSTYGNAKAMHRKSVQELRELRSLGLRIIYMGLESGDDQVLQRVNKWGDSAEMIRQAKRVREAGIKLNVTVLLGLGGVEGSLEHARETGRVLSAMDPEQVAALTLMLIPGTDLARDEKEGRFALPDREGMLRELRELVANMDLSRGLFFSNHASNYLPIKARMPQEKEKILELIDDALEGEVWLTPDWMRRL